MPLVEYDSSSSDEDNDVGDVCPPLKGEALPLEEAPKVVPPPPAPSKTSIPHAKPHKRDPIALLRGQSEFTSNMPSPSMALPDAALLLSYPSFSTHQIGGSDHSSRVAAAMAESASRKRAANGFVSQHPEVKHHKSSPGSKIMSDVKASMLIPPQLRGRSNVVTEDMNKLFVSKCRDPHH